MHLIGVSSLREAFAMVPETTYDVLLRKREQSVDICKYYKAQVVEANKDFTVFALFTSQNRSRSF